MAFQTSLKDLSKALSNFMNEPTVPPTDDLIDSISAYIERHPKYDESTADRLQEELVAIFDKQVKGDMFACTAWVCILRRLLPMIQTPARIMMWIDNLKGVISERTTHEKDAVEEIVSVLMELVEIADLLQDLSDGDTLLNPIIHHVLTVWMDRLYPSWVTGMPNMEHNERMFRDAITSFGKKRPQQLFASLDSFFVQKKYRKAALRFLCDFIQSRPPHLHLILHGTLFKNLLTCLQEDTSSAVVSSALTALTMILPHMPSSLVPHLPVLFNVYARVLFWNQELAEALELPVQDTGNVSRWEIYPHAAGVDDASISHLEDYYTILYGLYPINFMDYIRKPQRYLRHANVADVNEMEVQPTEIRDQSERFRRCHLLHPNFYTLTIDSEKTDFGRWIKSEAAQVVVECMALRVPLETSSSNILPQVIMSTPQAQGPLSMEASDRDGLDAALLSKSPTNEPNLFRGDLVSKTNLITNSTQTIIRNNSQSSFTSNRDPISASMRSQESGIDGQVSLTQSPSYTQLQDIIRANKAIKSGLHDNDGPGTGITSQDDPSNEDQVGARPPTPSWVNPPILPSDINPQVAHLKRQNMMLQNDLSFERYQKQQHIAHIGELRRKQMAEAATEAETQNLVMMNRNLKSRYEEAKKAEMQVRKESEKSRALAKKWEADLSNKVKNLRDQFQKTNVELQSVGKELEESKKESERLLRLVVNGEVRELNWKQNMQSIEMHGIEIDRLKAEVERLTVLERDHQAKEMERQAFLENAAAAERQVETLKMKLGAQEMELHMTKQTFQVQLEEVQKGLTRSRGRVGRGGAGAGSGSGAEQRPDIKNFLAASRAKQAELQTQYDVLLRKYTALQSSLLDMQSSPGTIKHGPRPRVSSTSERPESTTASATSTTTLESSGIRPDTPPPPTAKSGTEAGPSTAPTSPEQRFHGRGESRSPSVTHGIMPNLSALGGVQNRSAKGKSKDDGTGTGNPSGRKEKKTTGLKAFVRGVKE